MPEETRFAVARRVPGREYAVLEGPVALTAAGAVEGYALKLREGVDLPLRLSRTTSAAMSRAGQRLRERDDERARVQAMRRERRAARERGLAAWAAEVDW